jgi:hypothetical protein
MYLRATQTVHRVPGASTGLRGGASCHNGGPRRGKSQPPHSPSPLHAPPPRPVPQVGNAGTFHLARLPRLSRLGLGDTDVGDGAVSALTGLVGLTAGTGWAVGTGLTADAGLTAGLIAGLTAGLTA